MADVNKAMGVAQTVGQAVGNAGFGATTETSDMAPSPFANVVNVAQDVAQVVDGGGTGSGNSWMSGAAAAQAASNIGGSLGGQFSSIINVAAAAAKGIIEIKVTPEVLEKKAAELLSDIRITESLFGNISDTVNRTSSYWKGEAGDHHRQMFKTQENDIKDVFHRLHDYPINLDEISKKYSEVEKKEQERNLVISSSLID